MRCAGRTRSAGRTRKGVLWRRLAVVRGAWCCRCKRRTARCDVCCVESYNIFMSVDTLQLAARGLCSWAAPLRLRQHGHGTNANASHVTPACVARAATQAAHDRCTLAPKYDAQSPSIT
eukprot:scaffold9972_cov118-Isochrysis_galbana.AAC.20